MLKPLSIKSLYTLALTEGEGMGTAYEYFAKRLVLARWLAGGAPPARVLVAGLPQKYGLSLDFVQIAAELGAAVTVVDDRPEVLAEMETAVAQVRSQGWWPELSLEATAVSDMATLDELDFFYDLILCCEVIPRFPRADHPRYLERIRGLGQRVALFAPNGDNPAHISHSGLSGLRLDELAALVEPAAARMGYVDLPPFPPGVVRDAEQRQQAASGALESVAMWGLGYYARLERFLPRALRRRYAHIVYAFMPD